MQDLAQFSMMRSFRRDPSVQEKKLAPGTVRRIARFAAPYRRDLVVFLVLIVVAAFVAVLNPLIFKEIIDDGIGTNPPATGDRGLVIGLSLLVAGLALFDAVLQLWSRWCSTRIGEGLIYDMRAQVYAHISRMPIAFFTRTQTGALISRLNNDVLGAQSAFTGTLSGVVSNVIGVVLTLIAMLVLSWQITLLSLVLLPVFVVPAKLIGTKLQELTRESYALNASMTEHDDRALQRLGRPARQAVRPAGGRGGGVPRQGRAGARHRRHERHVRAGLLRLAHHGGRARDRHGVRRRRRARGPGLAGRRHGGRARGRT
jgi:ATP-binding cassette subfamily B protein